ncbi:hypothetical protein GCM10009539_39110 [Cryptosporangium japonicum]|uniref:Uncharacterized protein n=1 Tax=Cryptosporangium japonicum TaxID=80872 RepID=A0ABN0UGS9_9ACTN
MHGGETPPGVVHGRGHRAGSGWRAGVRPTDATAATRLKELVAAGILAKRPYPPLTVVAEVGAPVEVAVELNADDLHVRVNRRRV